MNLTFRASTKRIGNRKCFLLVTYFSSSCSTVDIPIQYGYLANVLDCHKLYSEMNIEYGSTRLVVTELRLRERRSCLNINRNRIKVLLLAVTVRRLIRVSSSHHNWIKIRAVESWEPPGNCLFSFHAPRQLEAVIKLSLEHRDLWGDLDIVLF